MTKLAPPLSARVELVPTMWAVGYDYQDVHKSVPTMDEEPARVCFQYCEFVGFEIVLTTLGIRADRDGKRNPKLYTQKAILITA